MKVSFFVIHIRLFKNKDWGFRILRLLSLDWNLWTHRFWKKQYSASNFQDYECDQWSGKDWWYQYTESGCKEIKVIYIISIVVTETEYHLKYRILDEIKKNINVTPWRIMRRSWFSFFYWIKRWTFVYQKCCLKIFLDIIMEKVQNFELQI